MGLLDRLRQMIRGTMRTSPSLFQFGNREVYTPVNTDNALNKGFLSNTAVYSIVMKDAQKFASIPRYVVSIKDELEVENALSQLLNKPNEYESPEAFMTKVRAYFKVCGEAFIWLNRGNTDAINGNELVQIDDEAQKKKPVLEMYVLPSNHVIVHPDPNDLWGVSGYSLTFDNTTKAIPLRKVDVIHWKNPNLNFDPYTKEHLRGFSPLSAGYKTLQQNNDATDATVRMHQNDGAKGVLFNETFDSLTVEQKAQLKGAIDKKINSNDIKGAVATLQGKWGYLDLMSSIDPKLLESKQLTWQELCFLLGVPYEFFDSQTSYANKEMAQRGWISNDIHPACKQLDGELERYLLPAFNLTGVKIESDVSELPEMQADMSKMVASLEAAWWLTPNERREAMEFEPSTDPTMDEIWQPTGLTPLSQANDGFQQMADQLRQQGLNDTNQ